MSAKCANCYETHELDPGPEQCMLNAVVEFLLVSGEIEEGQAADMISKADPTAFWEDLGLICDRLKDGFYDRCG